MGGYVLMGKLGLWHVGHFGLFPRHFDLIDALIILNHYFLFSKNDERLKQHDRHRSGKIRSPSADDRQNAIRLWVTIGVNVNVG